VLTPQAQRAEQSRARYPDEEGYVERDGVRTFYEVYGRGGPTILFLSPWSIVHSRCWKMQIPYFARHGRVVTFDARGNGKSDRPMGPGAYDEREFAADTLAVMEATGTESAVLVSHSLSAGRSLLLCAEHPERVDGSVFIGPRVELVPVDRSRTAHSFKDELDTDEGWAKWNRHYWRRDYRGFVEFFMSQMFTEPHSTKQFEDCVGWGLETSAETLIATVENREWGTKSDVLAACAEVRCPVLVIHGSDDAIRPHESGRRLAEATGGEFVTLQGSGHSPHARDPVKVNLLLRDFVDPPRPKTSVWTRGKSRSRRRALYISSPIGLGHAQRDVAIAKELRRLVPDLEIDWLAQHPVTKVLEGEGERIHPMSAELANESHHMESESAEHDLHCFQAWRRMDEILVANFMVFHDIVRENEYDLWIGDEAWELDYYLHENPELKNAAYVWLTDFVGWLPMEDGGSHESYLTADYNAEMIEHIDRFPRVRDRALFVGNREDVVQESFGGELPMIRDWTDQHFDFTGYITGFDPRQFADRACLRAELGYGDDERVCVVTVGGSGVGGHLLRRVIAAFPEAKERVPDLRMIVVCGPRIDPRSLPAAPGLEVVTYVHNLYRHLAACDLAVVQGGLTTSMELTAARRPFLYFPLRHHFEQNFHVRHRLERYGAGRRMDFDESTPEVIAAAISDEIGREVDYRPVETDGATRAATRIADLL
jgi:pimeloyl-ACP methyl ester carboxylesterase/predicted glycosyltransferase